MNHLRRRFWQPRAARLATVALAACLSAGATCSPSAPENEITATRAIELARPHVTFAVASVTTDRVTEDGKPAWKVVFRGDPVSPDLPELRPITIVFIDRRTGDVISIAKS